MILRSVTAGKISGTGLLELPGKLFGGAIISTDGTNAAVITIRKSNGSEIDGDIIFDISSKTPLAAFAPIESGDWIYYSISGTGASAQLFEWIS